MRFSQELEVGVKCMFQRRRSLCANHFAIADVQCADRLSRMTCTSWSRETAASICLKNRNSRRRYGPYADRSGPRRRQRSSPRTDLSCRGACNRGSSSPPGPTPDNGSSRCGLMVMAPCVSPQAANLMASEVGSTFGQGRSGLGQCRRDAGLLELGNDVDAALVAFFVRPLRGEERVHDREGLLEGVHATAEPDQLSVVVLAGQLRSLYVPRQVTSRTLHLVRGDLLTVAAAA